MDHLTSQISKRSNHSQFARAERRSIDVTHFHHDEELLADIGYKQELRSHYSTLQVFGIAFSIMGLLPSITTTLNTGLESSPAGLVWGWFCAGPFILLIGLAMTFLGSALPTSGGFYYWTNYYAPDSVRVPLSFLIGVCNTTGLCSGLCAISYGFAGEVWCVAFMSLISIGQYLMACSILIAASRQTWAFARDDGLPVVYNFVKYVNPKIAVPIRATMFIGISSIIMGLLVLTGPAGAGSLFSLGVMSNTAAWVMPVLIVVLPVGRKRFIPGPFYWGMKTVFAINIGACLWVGYLFILTSFPDTKGPTPMQMNYTCVINPGVWGLSLIYYYVYGHKVFSGPKSNLDEGAVDSLEEENEVLDKEKVRFF